MCGFVAHFAQSFRSYSRPLLFLTHNISIHTAHHVAPKVPFYRLNEAQAALRAALPGMIREKPFSWRALYDAARYCHLYDPETGFYQAFDHRPSHSPHGAAKRSSIG